MLTFICTVLFFIMEVISYSVIGRKKWYGWLIKMTGLVPLTVINITKDLYVFHLLNAFFLVIYVKNIFAWRKNNGRENCC